MKNVLFLLDSYFPNPSPNAICVRKVMFELLKENVTSSCVVLNDKKYEEFEVIDNIQVNRVRSRFAIRLISSNTQDIKLRKIYRKLGIFISRVQGAFLMLFWPFLSSSEVYRYYNKGKKLIGAGEIEVVVCVYKRIEALVAGVLLKRKYPKIKFVCYTIDCMSRSLVPRIRNTDIALNSVKRWERFIFSRADYICIMQSHQKHYEQKEYEKYSNKFVIMDIPLLDVNRNITDELNSVKQGINIVFTGSMSPLTANPSYFIKLLETIDNIDFLFNIYGGTSYSEISDCIKNSTLFGKKIFWHGVVPPNLASQKQREADVLISFGNDNECMVPCKIFEYIGLKKHVIHLYKSDSDSALPYFKKYGNTTFIKEHEDLSFENIKIIEELILEIPNIKIESEELLNKFYTNTPKPMADFLFTLFKENEASLYI